MVSEQLEVKHKSVETLYLKSPALKSNRNMGIAEELKYRLDQANLWDGDMTLERNEYLNVKGCRDMNFYFVESGSLKIYFEDDYEEQIIRLGYSNEFIGFLDAILSGQPSDLYIQALKKCELKIITKPVFDQFIQTDIAHLKLWNKLLERALLQQIDREKDILTFSPMKRYQNVLKRSPRLFQEIPAKYIASYLRMSPETLSRLKKS